MRKHSGVPQSGMRGFSLFELIMVTVVLAVLAAAVLSRYHQPTDTSVSIEADRLARDIRHMQMLAMTWGRNLRLSAAGNGYNVRCVTVGPPPCDVALSLVDPATGSAFDRPFTEPGVSVVGAALEVDVLGRPVSGASLLNSDTIYTLTGGSRTSTVTVSRLTGFVSVVY